MKKKILVLSLLIFLFLLLNTVISYGAISASSKTINSGENVTISVTSAESLGAYTIKVTDNGGLTFVSSSTSTGEANGTTISGSSSSGVKSLGSFTFKAPSVTEDKVYYVKITSSGTEGPNFENVSPSTATATITVKAPATTTPSPKPSTAPSPAASPKASPKTSPSPITLTFSSTNETVYANRDNVNVRSGYNTSSESVGKLSMGESVTRIGVSNTTSDGFYWSKVTYKGKTAYVASTYLAKTKPEVQPSAEPSTSPDQKTGDAKLKSLSISGVEISPNFSPDVTKYTGNIGDEVVEVTVLATVNNEKSKYEITGNKDLQDGENIVKVKVTAEDGTVNVYEINLRKGMQTKDVFVVVGIKEGDERIAIALDEPIILEDIAEYVVNLDEHLKAIEIVGTITDEKITYEGLGKFDLSDGENEYIIKLKESKDNGEAETTQYKLTINNPEKVVAAADDNNKNEVNYTKIGIWVGIAVVAVIVIIGAIIHYRKERVIEYGGSDYSFFNKNDNDFYGDNGNDKPKRSGKGGKHF